MITQQRLRMVDALIDQDGSLNVLSWEMWNALGQPKLSHTELGFINFLQAETTCLGCIYLQLCIQGELIYTLFYVANKSEILESVILGRTWTRKTKCQLDWENYTYTIEVNSQTFTGSSSDTIQDLLNEKEIMQDLAEETKVQATPLVWIPATKQSDYLGWLVKKSFLQSQGYDRGELHFWVPKSSRRLEPMHDSTKRNRSLKRAQQKRNKAKKQSSKTMLVKKNTLPQANSRWVPKTLLQAQGYHQGSTHLWLPKKRSVATSPRNNIFKKLATLKSSSSTPQFNNSNSYQWRPIIKKRMEQSQKVTTETKKPLQIQTNKKPTNKTMPSVADKGKWVPKLTMMVEHLFLSGKSIVYLKHHHN